MQWDSDSRHASPSEAERKDDEKKKTKMEARVPVIDVGKLSDAEEHKKLREACEKRGCFRIINHPIPLALMAEMKMVARSLLDLPMEVKRRNADVIRGSGYVAPTAANPLYEALGIYDLASSQALNDFCSQLDASPHQREVMEAYGQAIHKLAENIAQKMAESLGLIGVDYFKDWPSQIRINRYDFTPQAIGSSGVQIHTDSGFLTILQDDENVGGLEVMDQFGSFVEAPPIPGSLFVNLGDVAHIWSNGRFPTVKHRVQCKEAATRLSMATFLLGPREGAVEAPPELVDSEHPRLYVPITYEDSRNLRLSKNMRAGEALELLRIHQ